MNWWRWTWWWLFLKRFLFWIWVSLFVGVVGWFNNRVLGWPVLTVGVYSVWWWFYVGEYVIVKRARGCWWWTLKKARICWHGGSSSRCSAVSSACSLLGRTAPWCSYDWSNSPSHCSKPYPLARPPAIGKDEWFSWSTRCLFCRFVGNFCYSLRLLVYEWGGGRWGPAGKIYIWSLTKESRGSQAALGDLRFQFI